MENTPSFATTNGPLVSIIVPVYNVAPWLERCLQSLANQTYRNLEIIIMDDCSTDDSFKIAQMMATSDQRFHAYQMPKNAGAGDTRQAAIERSTGNYIGFVDGDDWVDNEFIAVLYGLIKKTQADIACCQHFRYSEKVKNLYTVWPYNNQIVTMTATKGMQKMRDYDHMVDVLWDKLYKREVICSHKMYTSPFEDSLIAYKYFSSAKDVALCCIPLYFYYLREGSLMHTQYTPYKALVRYKIEIDKDFAIADKGKMNPRIAKLHTKNGIKLLREFSLLEETPEIKSYCREIVQCLHLFDNIKCKLNLKYTSRRILIYTNLQLYLFIYRSFSKIFKKNQLNKIQFKYSLSTIDVFEKGL